MEFFPAPGGVIMPKTTSSAAGPAVSYSVKVSNTGKMDADDVVLGMMTPPGAGKNGIPLQTLFGFERVHVKAGESVTVNIYPEYSHFAQADADGVLRAHSGECHREYLPRVLALCTG